LFEVTTFESRRDVKTTPTPWGLFPSSASQAGLFKAEWKISQAPALPMSDLLKGFTPPVLKGSRATNDIEDGEL
jgi:hypothetical protein